MINYHNNFESNYCIYLMSFLVTKLFPSLTNINNQFYNLKLMSMKNIDLVTDMVCVEQARNFMHIDYGKQVETSLDAD